MDHYDKIADELDEELNGSVQRCSYDGDCILWSDPTTHPNRRYNPNNVAVVYLYKPLSKVDIKNDLLGYWFIKEVAVN